MYRKTGQHLKADAMSRLPGPTINSSKDNDSTGVSCVVTIQRLQEAPIQAKVLRQKVGLAKWTTIYDHIRQGSWSCRW